MGVDRGYRILPPFGKHSGKHNKKWATASGELTEKTSLKLNPKSGISNGVWSSSPCPQEQEPAQRKPSGRLAYYNMAERKVVLKT